jgi:hypothetical protein
MIPKVFNDTDLIIFKIEIATKILCPFFKNQFEVVEQYLKSKKLMKAKLWYSQDFKRYEPYIVAHKKEPKLLYCTLTKKKLNKIPEEIEAHVKGKRFTRLKAEAESRTKQDDSDCEILVFIHTAYI